MESLHRSTLKRLPFRIFRRIHLLPHLPIRPNGNLIYDLLLLENGSLAVCGFNEEKGNGFLDRFNPLDSSFTPIPLPDSLVEGMVFFQIFLDANGVMWIVYGEDSQGQCWAY